MFGLRVGGLSGAVRIVMDGGVVAYPTDTLYGLGALALRDDSVMRVMALKGRGVDSPVSVTVADMEMAAQVVDIGRCGDILKSLSDLLPGPYTVLLPSRDGIPATLVGPAGLVGLRIPANDLALSLARECGPITATSANRTGGEPPRSADEVKLPVDFVLDGGPCPVGMESTVFDPLGGEVLRRGAGYREVDAWLRKMSG